MSALVNVFEYHSGNKVCDRQSLMDSDKQSLTIKRCPPKRKCSILFSVIVCCFPVTLMFSECVITETAVRVRRLWRYWQPQSARARSQS